MLEVSIKMKMKVDRGDEGTCVLVMWDLIVSEGIIEKVVLGNNLKEVRDGNLRIFERKVI